MDKKSLIYGLALLGGSTAFLGWLTLNQTQAQRSVTAQNPPTQTQAQPQGQAPNNPTGSPAGTGCMGMMNSQQPDRHFIEMMIPHHQGAVDMAKLGLTRAKHPEIKKLAESIIKDQNREIGQMKAWYKQWYATAVPAAPARGMGMSAPSGTGTSQTGNQRMSMNSGMGMMGGGMMNMMTGDLEALKNAPDFDKAFIQQMIPHHKMAVMMAGMVVDSDRPEMRTLAKSILQTQSDEIERMRQWYQAWYR
ncbi:MAG: DUF305 domain-containing protein [Oscillatoria princeps RMCB-10]|jgi:uncharacterized protein (DUF305 family)|nr:DUF305 domain-containing protein [Oscillatoria princeps RMCB-10]